MGTPAIMSPVGINTEIVTHGENGFLAATDEEWFNAICFLIDHPHERERMGANARQTIIDRYSIESQKWKYLELFSKLTS